LLRHRASKIEALLQEANLSYRFCDMNAETVAKFLHDLPYSKNTGVVFPSSSFAALLGFRAPKDFAKLLARVRTLLTQGPVNLAFAQVPDAPADIIAVDWQLVAERIVADLVNKVRFIPREVVTFEAQWLRRVPFSTYALSI
jgi:hypothetical protein